MVALVLMGAFGLSRSLSIWPSGPASLDASEWVLYRDSAVGWAFHFPPQWHLQIEGGRGFPFPHDQLLITNVRFDLEHPDLGPSRGTDLWDMRELPQSFVVLELETPGDVSPGRRGSQTRTPLVLEKAHPGSRNAEFGIPRGVWIPVWIDEENQYILRMWWGPDATDHDREVAERIVTSIRFAP